MSELLPCPFCGGKADIYMIKTKVFHKKYDVISNTKWIADCSKCNCVIGTDFKDEEEAVKAWNTRYKPRTDSESTTAGIIRQSSEGE